jgi:hypothetical protein
LASISAIAAVMVGLALILPAPMCAAENSPSGRNAELPGVKLWFTDTGGTGTPIVLLHANTGTRRGGESRSWYENPSARKSYAGSSPAARTILFWK